MYVCINCLKNNHATDAVHFSLNTFEEFLSPHFLFSSYKHLTVDFGKMYQKACE